MCAVEAKTWSSTPPDAFPLMLGKLVANIGSLEFALRVSLYLTEVPADQRLPVATRMVELRAGDILETSALTSWDTLGQLIEKYNSHYPNAPVPATIRDLRDTLAHGRILTDAPTSDLKLIRFSRPHGDMVKVESVEALSVDWLGKQMHMVHDAVVLVRQRIRDLAP